MPLNAFRSIPDAHPFKGRATESAIGRMRLNYALLAMKHLNSPRATETVLVGYDAKQRAKDMGALDRLIFVFYADRLRALIDDAIRIFLENAPQRALKISPKHPACKKRPLTASSISPAIEDAGTKATKGDYARIAAFMLEQFGVSMFSPAELTYPTYVAAARISLCIEERWSISVSSRNRVRRKPSV